MTNREYMESLSDEELAKILWDNNIWNDYCFEKAEPYYKDCDRIWQEACRRALVEWLIQEKE